MLWQMIVNHNRRYLRRTLRTSPGLLPQHNTRIGDNPTFRTTIPDTMYRLDKSNTGWLNNISR